MDNDKPNNSRRDPSSDADSASDQFGGYGDARLQAIVNTAIDAIMTIDERGTIESCNAATTRLFGYTAEELIGHNVSMLMPSPYREAHDEYLANYLQTGVAAIIGIGREVVGVRKDGTEFPLDLAVSELWLGQRRLFTGILRDITDKKLSEERALRSERLAAIGQTMTGMVHESRNALQRTLACVEMLAFEVEGNEVALDLLRRIERAQDDLQRLFEEVRGYAGPISLELARTFLPECWREAWHLLGPQRRGRDVQLVEQLDTCESGESTCCVDRFRIIQVFRNLLENSLAACADPVILTISAAPVSAGQNRMLEITVLDNGPGFTAEQSERVFEPFFTTKTKGTGLGMAIALRIVEAHLGTITVRNNPNGGACVVIRLPCE